MSRSTHVATNSIISFFLWLSNIQLYICTTSSLSTLLSMDISVISMSWLLYIVVQWTVGCMYLFKLHFFPDRCTGAGLLDHMVASFFYLLRNLHTIFHNGCTIYIPTNSIRRFLFSTSLQHLLFIDFLMLAILPGVGRVVVSMCVSLIISNVERIFSHTYWLSFYVVFGELSVYLGLWPIFWLSCLFFFVVVVVLILSCMRCLYIVEMNPLSVASFASIFSHSMGCLFILFMVSFAVQETFKYNYVPCVFVFIFIALGGGSEKILQQFVTESVTYFPLRVL